MGGLVWLASYPKSGNTWLRIFLANLFANLPEPVNINTLTNFTFTDCRADLFERLTGKPFDSLTDDDQNRLRPQVHRLIAAARPESIFVKTHSALGDYDGVATITPEVTQGAVYIIRNPLDTAVSYAHHLGVSIDEAVHLMGLSTSRLATTGRLGFQMLGSWSSHVRSWVEAPGLNPHLMRYEDMATKAEATFGAFVQFLHLPPNRQRLLKAIRFSSFEVLSRQEKKIGFKERPPKADRFFRQGKVGGWRKTLTADHVAKLIADHAAVMRRFGYLDDNDRPVF
ncbi:MAG: sulfotransferase domain-containing protein [Rhodospirillaceae bacterium]|nr:sulfotransferase domain-containing protein [Rhodospirillaceae bacterium]